MDWEKKFSWLKYVHKYLYSFVNVTHTATDMNQVHVFSGFEKTSDRLWLLKTLFLTNRKKEREIPRMPGNTWSIAQIICIPHVCSCVFLVLSELESYWPNCKPLLVFDHFPNSVCWNLSTQATAFERWLGTKCRSSKSTISASIKAAECFKNTCINGDTARMCWHKAGTQ